MMKVQVGTNSSQVCLSVLTFLATKQIQILIDFEAGLPFLAMIALAQWQSRHPITTIGYNSQATTELLLHFMALLAVANGHLALDSLSLSLATSRRPICSEGWWLDRVGEWALFSSSSLRLSPKLCANPERT